MNVLNIRLQTDDGNLDVFAYSHAQYVTFQMAEVLVSKSLFHEILERIHRLKPVPIGSG